MSVKKVNLSAKPTRPSASTSDADAWVKNRQITAAEKEPTKRLTIDVAESLHRTIKMQCAARGSKIADEVRELLIQKYGKE